MCTENTGFYDFIFHFHVMSFVRYILNISDIFHLITCTNVPESHEFGISFPHVIKVGKISRVRYDFQEASVFSAVSDTPVN